MELFVSEEGDQAIVYHAQRSYYEVLLRAGVKIWMYRRPYILHSKSMTIDDETAIIGSSNMDMRSFGLNMEISMLVRGEEFVREMRGVEDMYRELSRELTLEEWEKQPLRSTVLDNLARLDVARCSSARRRGPGLGRLALWWRKWRFRSMCGCASVAPPCRWSPIASAPPCCTSRGMPSTLRCARCTSGTDVDILVRPADVSRLDRAIRREGWRLYSTFAYGSPFGHAQTYLHETWGYLDLHRAFPGIRLDPASAFDVLDRDGSLIDEVGIACRVPGIDAQAVLLLLNAARAGGRDNPDVALDLGSCVARGSRASPPAGR